MEKVTVFLDLEETLISDWRSGFFLQDRARFIRDFFSDFQFDMGIMSWAIENEKDKQRFNDSWRRPIEGFFNRDFDDALIHTVDDWCRMVNKNFRAQLCADDFDDFGTKENILFMLRNVDNNTLPTGTIFLVDDAISHDDIITSPQRTIKFLNAKKMEQWSTNS